MKLRFILSAAALLLASPSFGAGNAFLCAPSSPDSAGPRQVGGTGSAVPSGTLYSLNSQGCAPITQIDVAYFKSQGYTFGPDRGVLTYTIPVTATGTTSYKMGTLPVGTYVIAILASNSDATHGVTGGVKFGTTSSGTDIDNTALTVGTASSSAAADSAITRVQATSATTALSVYATAVTSWNTPTSVTFTVVYGYF